MNILHYVGSTDSRDGGVPRFVLDASRVMAAQGHPSTLLTCDTTDTPESWLDEASGGYPSFLRDSCEPIARRLPAPSIGGQFFSAAAMRTVREELAKCDVVHLHCVWSAAAFQIAAAARSMGVPYVVSLHGMLDDWSMAQGAMKKRAYLGLGGRYFLEKAARVHCTARAEFEQSKKWYPNGSEAIIPYIIDLEPYRELPGAEIARSKFECLNTGEPTVLFLSRLHYKKGCEALLKAAALMREGNVPGQIVFAGTGDAAYVQSLKDLAESLGVSSNVHFIGQVKGVDKVSLYQASDLFVLPTSQENFGLVLVEALASGTPLITTKGVDIWQDVESSGAAAIAEQDPRKLADSISSLTTNPGKLRDMASKARPWVFNTYDENVLTPRFEQFYAEAAATGLPASKREVAQWGRLSPAMAH